MEALETTPSSRPLGFSQGTCFDREGSRNDIVRLSSLLKRPSSSSTYTPDQQSIWLIASAHGMAFLTERITAWTSWNKQVVRSNGRGERAHQQQGNELRSMRSLADCFT